MARQDIRPSRAEQDRGRTALVAGTVAALGLFLQTVLFLVDAVGILPASPPFRESGAGRDEDLAAFFVAWLERQHDVAWNIALRDTVGPVAAIALIVLVRALVRDRGSSSAEAWGIVFAVGALLKLLSDVVYLSQLGVWRDTGFTPDPPTDIIAVGRTSEAVTHLADHLEHAAFVSLAVALLGLAPLLAGMLRPLALVVAAGLLVATVSALARWWTAYEITALLTGAVLAPILLVGLGRSLARTDVTGS